MTTQITESEIFAVDFAALAREIAMDIFPLDQILEIHALTPEQWVKISENRKFQAILHDMAVEWNTAANTKERVRVKSATGLESQLEHYITAISDPDIPLGQRVEAGKFLAKLGELGDSQVIGGAGGDRFTIQLNIGTVNHDVEIKHSRRISDDVIDAEVIEDNA